VNQARVGGSDSREGVYSERFGRREIARYDEEKTEDTPEGGETGYPAAGGYGAPGL
jgi:hypothetical protein